VAFTPDGKTAFVTNGGTVSTIDVKTRTTNPTRRRRLRVDH
jgi:DNA-binding beta-propeller fold protein YncE